jgi:hypothetical protein
MKRILCTILMAAALITRAADQPAAKTPLTPHPVDRTFNIKGVKTAADVEKVTHALKKVRSVTDVSDLTPTSGYIKVHFDTHVISSSLVAQTIMDQGPFIVSFDFRVPEYAQNAAKLDALFRKVERERSVKISTTDETKGLFSGP